MSNQIDVNKLVVQYRKHAEYMKAYNKRPEVRERRREYNKKRWQMIKSVTAELRKQGLL